MREKMSVFKSRDAGKKPSYNQQRHHKVPLHNVILNVFIIQ